MIDFISRSRWWLILVIVLLAAGGFGTWYFYQQSLEWENNASELRTTLNLTEEKLASTTAKWQEELSRNEFFAEQLSGISSTVYTLDKLRKTDPELLRKYSKVYFLNENYTPSSLIAIDPLFLVNKKKELDIRSEVWPFLRDLLAAASSSQKDLLVASAYRSFDEQKGLKSGYQVSYGAGANKFSADQGYSEHQLGTTVDFSTSKLGTNFSKFGKSDAYLWLQDNAYRYGFILSYPEKNEYYQFEPWHWRFVGVKLATKLHGEGRTFYNYSQRVINDYLVNIFDPE